MSDAAFTPLTLALPSLTPSLAVDVRGLYDLAKYQLTCLNEDSALRTNCA